MKSLFIVPLLIVGSMSFPAFGLETDNYLSWGKELQDVSDEINNLVAGQINGTLEYSNSFENVQSCEDITFQIAFRFKTTPSRKLFEDWTVKYFNEEQMFPATPFYLFESIYKDTARFYLRFSGLSPNLHMNGIYFGVDKLSHFGSTGRRYLRQYLDAIKNGADEEEAIKTAIRFGLSNEAGVLGLWPSGVFSYGDMEANYQGFRFYKKLCMDETDPYLVQDEEGNWLINKKPDLRDYVNPNWDETFNPSYHSEGMWSHVSHLLKENYCPMITDPKVVARFSTYKALSTEESFSMKYIRELQAEEYEEAPVVEKEGQSFAELCSSNPISTPM